MTVPSVLPPYRVLEEPRLLFDGGAEETHPLRGLIEHGPYSASAARQLLDGHLRVATIGPPGTYQYVGRLLAAFRSPQAVSERRDYLPPYPGFTQVLRTVQLAAAPTRCHLEMPGELAHFTGEGKIGRRVAAAVAAQMRILAQHQDSFDVVAVYLPERWRPAFTDEDDFDLHDAIKAVGAHLSIPTQVLNDDPWTYRCRASVAWRLTIALYTQGRRHSVEARRRRSQHRCGLHRFGIRPPRRSDIGTVRHLLQPGLRCRRRWDAIRRIRRR
jgi:hypothetical protein